MEKFNDLVMIHSLWRSGSTYFFNVFRRSDAGYFCYQEPLHEFVLQNQEDPKRLLTLDATTAAALSHPILEKPYLYELYLTNSAWKGKIIKEIIYDDYFAKSCDNSLFAYFSALARSAKGRPVIQECRTSGRIGALKEGLGGTHIYLSRNPWDQWWSFKTSEYFTKAQQMILNAPTRSKAIDLLLNHIEFDPTHSSKIEEEFQHFHLRTLRAEDSYLSFFMLWCLAWIEANDHADIIINLELLSYDKDYRDDIIIALSKLGLPDLNFDDCDILCSPFSSSDWAFFQSLEEKVFQILEATGTSSLSLMKLRKHRDEYQSMHLKQVESVSVLGDDFQTLSRARKIVLRQEDEAHSRQTSLIHWREAEQQEYLQSLSRAEAKLDAHVLAKDMWERERQQIEGLRSEAERQLTVTRQSFDSLLSSHTKGVEAFQKQISENQKNLDSSLQREHALTRTISTLQAESADNQLKLERENAIERTKIELLTQQHLETSQQLDQALKRIDTLIDSHSARIQTVVSAYESTDRILRDQLQHADILLTNIRNSLEWRITSPLRKLRRVFYKDVLVEILSAKGPRPPRILVIGDIGKFDDGFHTELTDSADAEQLEYSSSGHSSQLSYTGDYATTSNIASISFSDERNSTMMGSRFSTARNYSRANSLTELLSYDDEDFIDISYITVLGRMPDFDGRAYYLARLRSGHAKLHLLGQLRRSDEGRNHDPGIAGLDRAIRKNRYARLPVVGGFFQYIWEAEGDSVVMRKFRAIQNQIAVMRLEHTALINEAMKKIDDIEITHRSDGFSNNSGERHDVYDEGILRDRLNSQHRLSPMEKFYQGRFWNDR